MCSMQDVLHQASVNQDIKAVWFLYLDRLFLHKSKENLSWKKVFVLVVTVLSEAAL